MTFKFVNNYLQKCLELFFLGKKCLEHYKKFLCINLEIFNLRWIKYGFFKFQKLNIKVMKSQTRNQIVESFFQKNFLKSSKHVWEKKSF